MVQCQQIFDEGYLYLEEENLNHAMKLLVGSKIFQDVVKL